jgi:hypothetical protein
MTTNLVPMTEAATFDLIVRQADVLAQSGIVPAAFRRKPADIIAAGLAGRTYGWDPMTALRNFHVIEGTASLRPEAMLGLVRQAGHSVTIDVADDRATAHGKRADTGDEHDAVFTMADAEAAGLAKKRNWLQYRSSMLTWRAVSQLCRVLFPDVVLGAGYVPEEIGGEVNQSGELVAADQPAALPAPTEPFPIDAPGEVDWADDVATGDELADLKTELGHLDIVDSAIIKDEWKARGYPTLASGDLTCVQVADIVAMLPERTAAVSLLEG